MDFWEITPYELSLTVKAYSKKAKQEQEDLITAAYLTAYWQRVKKMPSLKEVLGIDKKPRNPKKQDQTPEEMLEEIKRLNAAFGGTTY